ncbi:hypothetical protein CR513_29403, partial [Mucuna pruriens]
MSYLRKDYYTSQVKTNLSEEGELLVDQQVLFNFSIEKYIDEILFGVVPMETCTSCLGNHDNLIDILFMMLISIICEDEKRMRIKGEQERKEKENERKRKKES